MKNHMTTSRIERLINTLKSRRFWLTSMRDTAILIIILFIIASYLQREMRTGIAPPIKAYTIASLPLSSFTSDSNISSKMGKSTLVYFWGTWCPICSVTSPMVNSVAKNGVYTVISVAVASGSNADIEQFMQQHNYHFSVINEDKNSQTASLSEQWGATALPAIYIVDKDNNIRFVTSGVTTSWGMSLRLWFASL